MIAKPGTEDLLPLKKTRHEQGIRSNMCHNSWIYSMVDKGFIIGSTSLESGSEHLKVVLPCKHNPSK